VPSFRRVKEFNKRIEELGTISKRKKGEVPDLPYPGRKSTRKRAGPAGANGESLV